MRTIYSVIIPRYFDFEVFVQLQGDEFCKIKPYRDGTYQV